jgi:hypothetical protein
MTTYTYDHDGIPRCQACNGQMILTQDGHYLVCEHGHGKLVPITSEKAYLIRQAYKNRDDPSQAILTQRWKENLPVAVKIGTFTKTDPFQQDSKKRVAVYKVADSVYEVFAPATQRTGTVERQIVACVVSKSDSRSAKLFAPLPLTEEQVAKLQKKAKVYKK